MAADDNTPPLITHHYLDGHYEELVPVGCTNTHAFLITRTGAFDYWAHRIPLDSARISEELRGGNYVSSWEHCPHRIRQYLAACIYDDKLCVFTNEHVVVYDAGWHEKSFKLYDNMEYVDACTMNSTHVVAIYNKRRIIILDWQNNVIVCDRIIDHGIDVSVVAVNFFMENDTIFSVDTSDNNTQLYKLSDKTVYKLRSISLLDTDMDINWTREISPRLVVSVSAFEMAIAWPRSAMHPGIRLATRTDFTAYIVDVKQFRSLLVVHDCENDLQLLNASLETVNIIAHAKLVGPHIECGLPVMRIQRTYRSLSTCTDSPNTLAVLLPSADLCTIRF